VPLWFWLGILLLALALLAALLLPLRFELSSEARAEPDGQWAAAAGVALGPVALSAVGARGVSPSLHVFLWGKRRLSRDLFTEEESGDEGAPEPETPKPGSARRGGWLARRFDPVDGLAFVLGERKRLRWQLDVDLSYSFRDVALTGKVLGGVYLLVPLLPSGIRLRQTPSWDSVDRAALQAAGTLRIFAGLVLCDLIWYMLKRSLAPRRKPLRERANQAWPKPKSSIS